MLLRRLAVGGMAEVYVAKTKGIGGFEKLVAIKVIHPRFSEDEHFVQMLVEEAKISVQLNHVNIAQTFDLGCIDDTYYIAMEFIEGADAFRVERRSRDKKIAIPIDICCYIASEVCNGLSYAHRKHGTDGKPLSIVHRDISPQNVLISYAGEVKLVDFGIAKAAVRSGQTEVGVIKGKYYYMSPEQAWGDPIDQRTDIFATGLLLHELLTGEMVYQEDNVPALLDRVRKADIPSPRAKRKDVPDALEQILRRALAKEASDRYPSAHAFGQDLTKLLYQTNPTFTAQRMAQLMGVLFPEEVRRHSESASLRAADSSDAQDLASMSRDDFTPSVEDSKLFDIKDVRRALADRQSAPPKPPAARADRPTKELRNPTSRPKVREGDTTAEHAQQDDWEEETVLKDDKEVWDESTLIDQDGQAMVEVRKMMKAKAQPPPVPQIDDDDLTHDVAGDLEGEKTVMSAGFPEPPRPPSKFPPPNRPMPPPMRALPARPAAAPEPMTPDPLSMSAEPLGLGSGAEPIDPYSSGSTDLPPEKTVALGQEVAPIAPPARRPAAISVPSKGGIRLGPDADRFFNAPPSNPAIALPASPLEPPPSAVPPMFAPPSGHDPFVAQPPPAGIGTTPEALGKPQPWRWILPIVIGVVVIGVTATAITLVATRPGPATLEVITVPPGASVQMDGLVINGVTPLTVPNMEAERTYHLSLLRRGYLPLEADVEMREGHDRRVFMLRPIRVTLHIETEPPGAQVWVDNTLRGSAPLDISGLEAGQIVMLRAAAPGHETVHQQITLDESETSPRITLRLRSNAP